MKQHTSRKAVRYMNELMRFDVHFAVYTATLSLLCLLCYLGRAFLGITWFIAILVVWTVVLFIHFLITRMKRGRFRKAGH